MGIGNYSIQGFLTEKMVWVVIGFSTLYWVQESVIHMLFSHNIDFVNELIRPETHELWHRTMTVVIFIFFGGFAYRMVNIHREAENRIKLAHIELNKIFNTAADGMRLVDFNYNVLRVNDTFSDMVGLKKEEIKGKKCYEVFKGHLCHTPSCPLLRISKGESKVVTDVIKEKPDGSEIPCILTATPYKGLEGELIGIIEDFKNMSDFINTSRALKESEEKYRLLVENSPFGIVFVDMSGDILGWNSKFSEIASEDFLKCKSILKSRFSVNAGIIEDILSALKDEKVSTFEKPYNKNGEVLYLRYTISPFYFEGNAEGLQIIVEDVTKRNQIERDLIKSEELYRLLAENAKDVIFRILLDPLKIKIEYISPAVLEMTGHNPEEFYRDPGLLERIVHPEDKKLHDDMLKSPEKFLKPVELRWLDKKGNSFWVELHIIPIYDEDDALVALEGIARNIDDRKIIDLKLVESEDRYRSFAENFHGIAYRCTIGLETVFIHGAVEEITGYSEKEFMDGTISLKGIVHPEDRKYYEDSRKKLSEIPNFYNEIGYRILKKGGEMRWIQESVRNICDGTGKPSFIHGAIYDITAEKEMEDVLRKNAEALKESEARWKALYQYTPVPIYIWQKDGDTFRLVDYNTAAEEITSGVVKGLKGITDLEMYKDRPDIIEDFRKCFNEKKVIKRDMPYFFSTRNRELFFSVSYAYLPPDYVIVHTEDITENKEAEERTKTSLREKEALLKEIHHRVKNNLQIISSLLNLQSKYVQNEDALVALRDSQRRIKSMALVHEKLYQSEDLARIDFKEYISSLVSHLLRFYQVTEEKVKLNMDVEDVFLNIETAIPCSLIINELVSNSLKHAFPGDRGGELIIRLSKDNGYYSLELSDNGIGFPRDIDFRKTDSLGLQLVINLVEQLDGEIEMVSEKGVTFNITFSQLVYNERG